ncbi:acetylornithine deacetylase [Amorphus orientalis]|uniref:Acetylornithine deacetylase n=1 Tax=Amorphus orientalis TaxID=649198 RepID=A0AAE3VKN4_9HYPH|nr:acetylornithine deacetylase [Amorphus orientalis]MDQ0313894.1 acetylornithine deacetylase [Amorphus orientalis]
MSSDLSAREMLDRLVAFPTVSSESNLSLLEFIRTHLAAHGIDATYIYDKDGDKANLYATIGPKVAGGVVLSGHTDVVPVESQPWTSDPWTVIERDGRLIGRGTADMKAFVAIALALVPEMAGAGLERPIHLALSYDEEVGCLGAPSMIADMAAHLPPPSAVIVGEPTSMRVVTGQKTTFSFTTNVRGKPVHSSQVHLGVSAVTNAARLVTYLDDMLAHNMANPVADCPFDPPFTTIHTGMINGGTAHNIVARDCSFVTDIRALPDDDPHDYLDRYRAYVTETIEPRMKAVDPDAGVKVAIRAHVPGLVPQPRNEAESLCRRITGDNGVHAVSYGTEAGQYREPGWDVVVCGPGSIDQAHQPDEYLTVDQLDAGTAFMRGLIAELS